MLETRVHGVVVHTSRSAPSSSGLAPSGRLSSGNRTVTAGSVTGRYTSGWPISWSDSGVSQRGQYGLIRKSLTSRPLVKISFSDHHTDSM